MPIWLLKFAPWLIGVVAVIGAFGFAHHKGYKSGQKERESYYGPIILAAQSLATAAHARLKAQERDTAASIQDQETRHAQSETALQSRAAAAERDYRRILSQRAPGSGGCPGAPATPTPAQPDSSSGELGSIGADATLARAIAEKAVQDAQRVVELQRFYDEQRAILNR